MSDSKTYSQLSEEKLNHVLIFLAKIIGEVGLLLNCEYGKINENSDEFLQEIKHNTCRTITYWYLLKQNVENQREDVFKHLATFLHDSRSSSNFIHGYSYLLLNEYSEELNIEQKEALLTIEKYWEHVEETWQSLLVVLKKNADTTSWE